MMIKTSAKKSVQILVNHCISAGMTHVVISPGSRNAPLIIAFNQHPKIECLIVPDERSAAFIALGMAQQQGKAVGIVCTSGSAPLNYYPAIAEAYYQCIPLIVITADRPSAWINQGDGQTIVQQNVFENHINYFVQLDDVTETTETNWYIKRELSIAFNKALGKTKGPVHLNISLSEPLYEMAEIEENSNADSFDNTEWNVTLGEKQKEKIKESWLKNSKKLILCGQLNPNQQLKKELIKLSQDPSVLILVENTSNLVDEKFVHCIDRLSNSIPEGSVSDFKPDLLITIGGAVVSKRIKALIRKNQPKEQWKIGFDFPSMDTYQCLTHSFEMEEASFFEELNQLVNRKSSIDYGIFWKQKDLEIQQKQKEYFQKNVKLSDITAFNLLLSSLPKNSHLHMANSSVVRYCQLMDSNMDIQHWSNRGTSGIDGSTSTAVGAAFAKKEAIHTLISGDMSFFYDSNAFWNHIKTPNLKIFLINNGGGGIFKIIPGPDQTEEQDEFFVFDNSFSAKDICKAFGVQYFSASDLQEIENQLADFYLVKNSCSVMEIFTNTISNEEELKKYFDFIRV